MENHQCIPNNSKENYPLILKKKKKKKKKKSLTGMKMAAVYAKEEEEAERQNVKWSMTLKMDDPNVTMEEYIRLEEEKAQKCGKVFNWETAKYDSEIDNDKVNMPLFPSTEPSISCIDDLDFFKDFEKEFPAIVYNDALTSKLDFSTEPTLCPQHIDEFDLKDETSLSEYLEKEQNVLYFNDLFPFNIIYPADLKSDKDNDDNELDMIQSSGGNENT
ncbi:hypothetical protein Tco_1516299 [Tanacetum coccineum]